MTSADTIAAAFVEARRRSQALTAFPGPMPVDLAEAYRIQGREIALWRQPVAGWKVAAIRPEFRSALQADRLAGPVFADGLIQAVDGEVVVEAVAAFQPRIESEVVVRLKQDVPPGPGPISPEEAWSLIDLVRIGVEIAGGPLATLSALGPTALVAGFGNNLGLILGPVLNGSRRDLEALDIQTTVNGRPVGRGTAGDLGGGLAESVRFLVEACERYGQPLPAGAWISTGAIGGGHPVAEGDKFSTSVNGVALISGRVEAAGHLVP